MELLKAYIGLWPFGSLTKQQREGLQRWRYYVENRTLLDPCMQVFWCWLSSKVPDCILPCTITVLGVLCNSLPGFALLFYSPDARQEVPPWLMVVAAVGLFLYQTADALDGKQCLRLNRDSPLEEIYDHGMDALTTGFVTMNMCIALGLGDFPYWMFMAAVSSALLFFTYHWQTYTSGVVVFGKCRTTYRWSRSMPPSSAGTPGCGAFGAYSRSSARGGPKQPHWPPEGIRLLMSCPPDPQGSRLGHPL